MGSQTLRSKPTIHNDSLNNKYQQRDPPSRNASVVSDQVSDLTSRDPDPRSPVSPLDSHGETWKHPPRAHAQLKGTGPIYSGEAPKGHFRSRPLSFYDGLAASPEPDDQAVFADMRAPPPARRLSRPFEQPYPMYDHVAASERLETTAAAPSRTKTTSSDPQTRRQPAHFSSNRKGNRKAAPPPITIPPPAHRTHVHRKPVAEQNGQTRAQKPARHQGWNPLAEPPRWQRSAQGQRKDQRHNGKYRGDDVEWGGELLRSKNRSRHDDPQYESGRRCFFFLVVMLIVVVVIIVVGVERSLHQH